MSFSVVPAKTGTLPTGPVGSPTGRTMRFTASVPVAFVQLYSLVFIVCGLIDMSYPVHRYFVAAKHHEFALGGATTQLRRIGSDLASGLPASADKVRDLF